MNKDDSINKEALKIFEKIFEAEEKIPQRWVSYCRNQLKFYGIDKREYHKSPEDIVDEVIFAAINGTRKWDTEKVQVEAFVKSCIKSIVSHLADGMDNKKADQIVVNKKLNTKIDALENAHNQNKEQIESLFANKDLIERCRAELEQDTEMGLVFELLLEEKTPKEMEAEYGIAPEKVDAVKKRIRRFLKKIFDEEDYNN